MFMDGTDDGHDEAKVVFPIPEDGISGQDAVETLFEIAAAELHINGYDVNGNDPADDLYVDLYTDYHNFHRAKLIDLLEFGHYGDDGSSFDEGYGKFDETWTEETAAKFCRLDRLFIRLIRAYHEWKKTDATYSPDELRANPLQPLNNNSRSEPESRPSSE